MLFAATWFHREVGWELRRTLEGGRAGNGVADSVPRHGCCFRGDDVVCSSFASQKKYIHDGSRVGGASFFNFISEENLPLSITQRAPAPEDKKK